MRSQDDRAADSARPYGFDKGVIGGPDEVVDLSTRTIRGGTKEGRSLDLFPYPERCFVGFS